MTAIGEKLRQAPWVAIPPTSGRAQNGTLVSTKLGQPETSKSGMAPTTTILLIKGKYSRWLAYGNPIQAHSEIALRSPFHPHINDIDNHSHIEAAMTESHPLVLSCFSFAGQIVVWAGRQWIRASEDWDRVTAEFTNALGDKKGRALTASLDDLFSLMNVAARRPVVFGPCTCHRVWPDEALVLSAIQAEQRGQTRLALDALAGVLPPGAVRQALPLVSTIAHELKETGYHIESCRDSRTDAEFAFENLTAEQAGATLH